MKNYKLLTPGPLTTTDTVKKCCLTTVPGMMITKYHSGDQKKTAGTCTCI